MAALKSIELTQLAASAQDFLLPHQKQGRVRVAACQYALGDITAAGTMDLFRLPKGASVVLIIGNSEASHGAGNISIGDSSNTAKYRAAATYTTVGAAIANTAAAQAVITAEGVGIPYTAETLIYLTNSAATGTTGTAKWVCLYVVD
jgi:hypothetical protein